MLGIGPQIFDFVPIWTWALMITRFMGILMVLPGIGTDQFPREYRFSAAALLSVAVVFSGVRAPEPKELSTMLLMLSSEFAAGFVLGLIPSFVLAGLAVAGQTISGAIGLTQANMIDPSLGVAVSLLSRLKTLLATSIFLIIGGHHVVIRAAAGLDGNAALGAFTADGHVAEILTQQFSNSFHLALMVSVPIMVTSLVTQFLLGLVSKFVPQLNIFIVAMPLLLIIGLYMSAYTLYGLREVILDEFSKVQGTIFDIFPELQDKQT